MNSTEENTALKAIEAYRKELRQGKLKELTSNLFDLMKEPLYETD